MLIGYSFRVKITIPLNSECYHNGDMAVIFDGRELAEKMEKEARGRVEKITVQLGRRPKLVTIYNPGHGPSRVYTELKAKKAGELGIEFQVYQLASLSVAQLSELVKKFNMDNSIDGIMIQMPLFGGEKDPTSPEASLGARNSEKKLCELIDPLKDVDGLNPKSGVLPAVVRAVLEIIQQVRNYSLITARSSFLIVGNKGMVGKRLEEELGCRGMDKEDFDPEEIKQADIIISCTGVAGLIKPEMVKEGAVAVDVGYPKGDFLPQVANKAAFFTPVPGGVGPVTVVCLFVNLADLVEAKLS